MYLLDTNVIVPDQRPDRDALIAATAMVHGEWQWSRGMSLILPPRA